MLVYVVGYGIFLVFVLICCDWFKIIKLVIYFRDFCLFFLNWVLGVLYLYDIKVRFNKNKNKNLVVIYNNN